MNYKARRGVVLTSICGRWMLIPMREAFPACKRIFPLSLSSALLWDLLANGKSVDEYVNIICKMSRFPEEKARKNAQKMCDALCQSGFLIEVPAPDSLAACEPSPREEPRDTQCVPAPADDDASAADNQP